MFCIYLYRYFPFVEKDFQLFLIYPRGYYTDISKKLQVCYTDCNSTKLPTRLYTETGMYIFVNTNNRSLSIDRTEFKIFKVECTDAKTLK